MAFKENQTNCRLISFKVFRLSVSVTNYDELRFVMRVGEKPLIEMKAVETLKEIEQRLARFSLKFLDEY